MRTAIYPGTFDPVTYGHIDIVHRAAELFDKVIIAIANDTNKETLFTLEERLALWQYEAERDEKLRDVTVTTFTGLTVEFARQNQATALIRGLRALTDFEYEFQLALMNKKMNPGVETVFLITRSDYSFISSSIIKTVAKLDGPIRDFVPENVEKALRKKLKQKKSEV